MFRIMSVGFIKNVVWMTLKGYEFKRKLSSESLKLISNQIFQAAYGYIQVFVFSTLYLAPAVYPIIFGFMLRDVQVFLRKLFSCFFSPEPEKCPDYSPSMQTRLTHASRTVTPMGTPELP